jgi:hypothetical protein
VRKGSEDLSSMEKMGMVACACSPSYGGTYEIKGSQSRPSPAKSEISKTTRAKAKEYSFRAMGKIMLCRVKNLKIRLIFLSNENCSAVIQLLMLRTISQGAGT